MIKIINNEPEILGEYDNGNYHITMYSDGTKVRETKDPNATEFIAEYPESMDVKICNRCSRGCPMCHEKSTPNGGLGDIMGEKFWKTLKPYTEIAMGGGNVLEHPDLVNFLLKAKSLKLIPNMTVHQADFMENWAFLKFLCEQKLVYGLGISLVNPTDDFIAKVKEFPNAVVHVINGIVTREQLDRLANKGLKMLILGYKVFGRGEQYYKDTKGLIEKNKQATYDYLEQMVKEFSVVSFDNIAIEQLDVKRLMSEEEWNSFYMGDEGKFTMYLDLVERKFAMCSVATERFDMLDDIKPMFEKIKSIS